MTTERLESGLERIGSVGDLSLRHIAAIRSNGELQVWVIGCFEGKANHRTDSGDYRRELYEMAIKQARRDVRDIAGRAKAFIRDRFRRK